MIFPLTCIKTSLMKTTEPRSASVVAFPALIIHKKAHIHPAPITHKLITVWKKRKKEKHPPFLIFKESETFTIHNTFEFFTIIIIILIIVIDTHTLGIAGIVLILLSHLLFHFFTILGPAPLKFPFVAGIECWTCVRVCANNVGLNIRIIFTFRSESEALSAAFFQSEIFQGNDVPDIRLWSRITLSTTHLSASIFPLWLLKSLAWQLHFK